MKKKESLFNFFMIISLIVFINLACGRFSGTPTTPQSNTPVNSPTPPTNQTNAASQTDIAGKYEVAGTNVNGSGTYKGSLVVTKQGEVYQFSWETGNVKYDGVGVQTDNAISVSYTSGTSGKGCGVALYKINPDRTLDGKEGYWGVNTSESEKAVRVSGTDLNGDYEVTGKDTTGKEYKTKLTILPSGPGYTFNWKGESPIQGIGIKQGDILTAGFGGNQCSFVAYELKSDGSLEGKWGGAGTVAFGTEKAVKK